MVICESYRWDPGVEADDTIVVKPPGGLDRLRLTPRSIERLRAAARLCDDIAIEAYSGAAELRELRRLLGTPCQRKAEPKPCELAAPVPTNSDPFRNGWARPLTALHFCHQIGML